MTREEFYKLTDILNSEVLGNFMHGGEADELIAMFEEAVEHSNILEQEEPVSKFDSCIQPGDDIRYNEELGCRVNLSQLQRVAKKDPKYCIYTKDSYTDEERKVLCDGCEEDCEYNQKKETDELTHSVTKISDQEMPVSVDLENAAFDYAEACKYKGGEKLLCVEHFKAGSQWKEQQMMVKAIDGDITFDYYGDDDKTYGCIAHDSFRLEDFGLKDRDKVKIIVIKEG